MIDISDIKTVLVIGTMLVAGTVGVENRYAKQADLDETVVVMNEQFESLHITRLKQQIWDLEDEEKLTKSEKRRLKELKDELERLKKNVK